MKDEFYYLCDGKMCEVCNPGCYHTPDLAHALNFIHEPTEEEKRDRFMLVKSDPVNLINEFFILLRANPTEHILLRLQKAEFI